MLLIWENLKRVGTIYILLKKQRFRNITTFPQHFELNTEGETGHAVRHLEFLEAVGYPATAKLIIATE